MEIETILQQLNFTNLGWQIIAPLIFSLADVITGYIQAVINDCVDSKVMREGLLHKILLILIIMLSFVISFAFGMSIVPKIVCGYIILMEAVSISENLVKAGVDLGKLSEILKIKKEGE